MCNRRPAEFNGQLQGLQTDAHWAMQALETPGLLIQELAPSSQHQVARAQKPFAVSVLQACHQARLEAPTCMTLQEMRTKLHKFDNARNTFLEGSL